MKFHLVFIGLLFLAYGNRTTANHTDIEFYSSSIKGYLKLLKLEEQFMIHVKGYGDALQEKLDTLKL